MASRVLVVVTVSLLVVICQAVVPGPKCPPTKGKIWPKPQTQTKVKTVYSVDGNKLDFKVTQKSCSILTAAVDRAMKTLHKLSNIASRYHSMKNTSAPSALRTVNIELAKPCEAYPYYGMDESYNLTVAAEATVASASIWGILHGLESFLHLVYQSDDYKTLLIKGTEVYDYPRHPHRGLLLDTSRHYLSVRNILVTLNAMAMNKLNVFHWHIVDDPAFPYQSERFPELSEKGAYHASMVYTKADIQKIVEYARYRGIRVIPEIDAPGHVRSWGEAYPQILTECYTKKKVSSLGPLDPTKNETYKLLGQLLKEVRDWFPDGYFHIGGDEVDHNCWISNPSLLQYMLNHNMSSPNKLHALFMELATPLIGNRTLIVWQEVFTSKVPLSNDTVVQIWRDYGTMNMVLNAGKKALFSTDWYLSELDGRSGDWLKFYDSDPRQKVQNKELVHEMIGGEACMWGEYVDDMNFLQRIWPRGSAIAERLWSEASRDHAAETMPEFIRKESRQSVSSRLEEHACRMRRRGVPAQPPNGPGFCLL